MIKTYKKIQNKNVYLVRFISIIFFILLGIILFLSYGTNPSILYKVIIVIFSWSFIAYIIPLLVLFFNYRQINKNSLLIFDANSILYKSKSKEFNFMISEIKTVEFNLSLPMYNNQIRLFFWDEYFYATIYLKNKQKIYITCLLCDELEKFIPSDLIIKKGQFFPIIDINNS